MNNNGINIINKTNKTSKENILLEDSLKIINNSCSIGTDILIELDDQQNKLESTNDILESDEYLLNKALKTIRNMTWSGMIWNLINSEPIETSKNIDLEKTNVETDNKKKISGDKIKINCQTNKTKQDEYLEQISLKLEELHKISLNIGFDLENQNNLIEQTDTNTKTITNKMLKVDLETKKITNSYKKLNYKLVGKFNFVDIDSGLALSTNELGLLMLTNKIDSSTIFQCYSTSNNIYSIQNYKTQKYLKTDFFGNIGCTGNYIGTYEQCFLNLELDELSDSNSKSKSKSKSKSNINIYKPTGILILSKNNYHGGWLKKPKLFNLESETNDDLFIMNTTTSNTTNTSNMIIFQPIKLD